MEPIKKIIMEKRHDFLSDKKSGSLARLQSQLQKLQQVPDLIKEYHNIFQEHLLSDVLEYAPDKLDDKRAFYMLHRAAIKTATESAKIQIVFFSFVCFSKRKQ